MNIISKKGRERHKINLPVWWCRDDFGVYTSIHFGQYNFTIASPGTSESPIGSIG
jgi:hypothetical protein